MLMGEVLLYIFRAISLQCLAKILCQVLLWLQVHLAHLMPFLLGYYYRPPSANSQYLNNMGEMLDSVCDLNRECYFIGDLPEY